MRRNLKKFCARGMAFSWGGPVILAIVWMCLKASGTIVTLAVEEAVMGILTTTIMAFIAAGVSIVYQIENLPRAFAGLIQGTVLYIDYLGFYLLNGWIPVDKIWMFTLIYLIGFVLIWFGIYIPTRIKVNRINQLINSDRL